MHRTKEQVFSDLRLTFSQRRIAGMYIYEINRRENINETEILASADLSNRKDFLQSLFARRFPETNQLIESGLWQI